MNRYSKEQKKNFVLFCLDALSVFRSVTSEDERKAIVALARGLNHPHATHLANLLMYSDDAKLFMSEENQEILRKSVAFFMEQVGESLKQYVNLYGFKPEKPDPLKITYFFIFYLYQNRLVDSMDLLKRMMEYVLKDAGIDTTIDRYKDSIHLFDKGISHSSKSPESFAELYGTYGFYKVYKLTYRLLKCLHIDQQLS
jgi:hypothetical protein